MAFELLFNQASCLTNSVRAFWVKTETEKTVRFRWRRGGWSGKTAEAKTFRSRESRYGEVPLKQLRENAWCGFWVVGEAHFRPILFRPWYHIKLTRAADPCHLLALAENFSRRTGSSNVPRSGPWHEWGVEAKDGENGIRAGHRYPSLLGAPKHTEMTK